MTQPIGQIFLRLLFMLVIPLLFSALVVGISEMGEIKSLKRVGLQDPRLTRSSFRRSQSRSALRSSTCCSQAPASIAPPLDRCLQDSAGRAGEIIKAGVEQPSGIDAFISIVPNNLVEVMGSNSAILSVMFFALFFGIGLLITDTPNARALQRGFEGLFDVTMRLILLVIKLAPIAVACFMFNLAALFGWDLLIRLSAYVGVVLLALGIQLFIVYPILLKTLGRKSPIAFFREVQEAMVMAFSTASSNATLPTALRVAEEKLKLPRRVSRFVLTIGATANQNGTAMFEGVTVIFLAQFFGIELTLVAAADGDARLHPGRYRHRRRSRGIVAGRCADPGDGRDRPAGDCARSRRRSFPRHVQDDPQRRQATSSRRRSSPPASRAEEQADEAKATPQAV